MHKKTKLCNKNRMHTIFPANMNMQLSEILTYAGVALIVALVYNMSRTSGAQGQKSTIMIISLILVVALAYMVIRNQESSAVRMKPANLPVTTDNDDILAEGFAHDQDSVYEGYPEHDQEEAYTDMASLQNMHSRMDAIVPKTLRGEAYDDMPSRGARPDKKAGFAAFTQSDTEYSVPLAKRHQAQSGSAHTVQGNFLDVTSKEANTHGQVGTNSALLPIMEQYMKVHENDPTRTTIWQSNNGVPSYDIRDPINVQLNDFPRTVSAKLPVV